MNNHVTCELIDFSNQNSTEVSRGSARLRFSLLLCASLVLAYHVDNALADVVKGTAIDAGSNISLSWEYDLENGTGKIDIRNLGVELDSAADDYLWLRGVLLPAKAENIEFVKDPRIDGRLCDVPTTSSIVISGVLPKFTATTIHFEFPVNRGVGLHLTDANFGKTDFLDTTSACGVEHLVGTVKNFLSVQPY